MPSATKWFNESALTKAAMTATDGRINGFPYYNSTLMGNPHLSYMDSYWLQATGRNDVPDNTDDFYKMLVDIKALMGSGNYPNPVNGAYPLGFFNGVNALNNYTDFIGTAFTGTIMMLADPNPILWAAPDSKNIAFMPTQPGFRESIAFMRRLYVEGLTDPEVFTMDQPSYLARLDERRYAVYQHGNVTNALRRGEYTALRPLKSQFNNRNIVKFENAVTLNAVSVTDRAKNPEIIARYFDYFYNTEADRTNNENLSMWIWQRGFYGQQWAFADPARTTWEFLRWPDNSPVDWTSLSRQTTPQWNTWPGVSVCGALGVGDKYNEEKQRTTGRNTYPYCTTDTWYIAVYTRMFPEETQSIQTQLVDLQNYWKIAYMRFMTGQMDVDRDWNAFIAECNRIGADRITATFQKAYDRWNAALQ